jgi:hypothetical protein
LLISDWMLEIHCVIAPAPSPDFHLLSKSERFSKSTVLL